MNREIISIDSACNGFEDAVKLTDKIGEQAGLTKKEGLRLHLLSEELIGLLRGIAGDIKADYIVEEENKKFTLHLKGEVNMDKKMHDQLIESSTKGENAAVKGFMGKMREMIGTMLLPGTTPKGTPPTCPRMSRHVRHPTWATWSTASTTATSAMPAAPFPKWLTHASDRQR